MRQWLQLGLLFRNNPSATSLSEREAICRHFEGLEVDRKMLNPMIHANLRIGRHELAVTFVKFHSNTLKLPDHGKTRSAIVRPSQTLWLKSGKPPPAQSNQ